MRKTRRFSQVSQPEIGFSITPIKKSNVKATEGSTRKSLKRSCKATSSTNSPAEEEAEDTNSKQICTGSSSERRFSPEKVDDKEEEEEQEWVTKYGGFPGKFYTAGSKAASSPTAAAEEPNSKQICTGLSSERSFPPEKVDDKDEEEEWVTVYGFNPCDADFVLRELRTCGVIQKHVRGLDDSNWMHILFKRRGDAQKALEKSGMKINGALIVGVKLLDSIEKQKLDEEDLKNQDFQDLRLLHRSAAYFFILGSTCNVYTVRLSRTPSCNCPDSAIPCNHILFVYTCVLNLPYRAGDCTASLLTAILNTAATAPDTLASAHLRDRFHHLFLMSKVGSQVGPSPPMVKLGKNATCSFDGCIAPSNEDQGDSEETEDAVKAGECQDWDVVQCGTCKTVGHKECLAFSSTWRGCKVFTCMICEKECWMDHSVLDSYPNLTADQSDDESDQGGAE